MGIIKEKVFANAASVWVGAVYLFCSLAVTLFPRASLTVARSWFHGFDLGDLWLNQPMRSNFWLGLVSAVGLTWIAAWLFAKTYNYLATRT
ncbi:hypothetical protein A3I57_02530 [Candidatus Beckwithbacteria bacterium RIFCSPLOWO2_02_FULL_47_23]|uniref:Uncharacterized protein n=1 Tax=Candidatus Beckwithbacteria bacterium RIFCSPLOWO2_02_FULL_47_23 TaxID=1797463 RepID=A0A1F5DV86_9BACT|nr:MAG: hypothetical protein A3I57_02530 [Candidatus Beckwithbacteria bacterium RIFCSPLOWO2_02_FULL_47_23]